VHAKTVADHLVGTACAKCKVARVARPLPKEAYAPLLDLLRFYRRWPARAAIYVPAAALLFAVVAAGTSFTMKANAREHRASFIAEYGPTRVAPTSPILDLMPEAPLAFVAGLGIVGAIGVAVFLGVAATFRARVQREARRLTTLDS